MAKDFHRLAAVDGGRDCEIIRVCRVDRRSIQWVLDASRVPTRRDVVATHVLNIGLCASLGCILAAIREAQPLTPGYMLRSTRRVDARGDEEVSLYIDLIRQCLICTVGASSRRARHRHGWWSHIANRVAACRSVVLFGI